jgi:DNA-binding transcriptional LysR family regulator
MPVVPEPPLRIDVLPRKPEVQPANRVEHHLPVEGGIGGPPHGGTGRVGEHLGPPQMIVVAGVELAAAHEPDQLAAEPHVARAGRTDLRQQFSTGSVHEMHHAASGRPLVGALVQGVAAVVADRAAVDVHGGEALDGVVAVDQCAAGAGFAREVVHGVVAEVGIVRGG